jgi:preprotein translocase subunit SecE
MAKAKSPPGRRTPPAQPVLAGSTVSGDVSPPKKRTSIPQFISQVRAEGRKIVWPSRKETWITSVMVLIMVLIAAVFFWIVDWVLAQLSVIILAIGQ